MSAPAAVALAALTAWPVSVAFPDRAGAQTSPITAIDVIAHEYAFTMPDTVPAGLVTFRLHDAGAEWHHVKLARLDAGRTLAEAYAALRTGGSFPPWMHFIGGPNAPAPEQVVAVTLALEPGRYAVWCNVSAPDGQPHWARGMFRELVVSPAAGAAALPAGGLPLALRDYAFDLPRPITRGARTIRVTNAAGQAHEIFILHLEPNAGIGDVRAWLEKRRATAPGEPFGGTTDIPPGGSLLLRERFLPGRYAFVCWVGDVHDGRPHWRHGMVRVIDVR